jgi:hypothetical protein
MNTISSIKKSIEQLTNIWWIVQDPRVVAAIAQVKKENAPKVEELQARLKQLQDKRKPKLRWPEDTPEEIVKLCKDYWSGTTELATFRIHKWNDKAVWTSYPAGGFSTTGGFTPTPPAYFLISRSEREDGNRRGGRPKELKTLSFERNSGKRVTPDMMKAELDKL